MSARSTIVLVAGLAVFIAAASALLATRAQTPSEFSDPDVDVRRAAFRRIAEQNPEMGAQKSLEIAEKALTDPDEEIRSLSGSTIGGVLWLAKRRNTVDWDSVPVQRLAKSLQQAAVDGSPRVRYEATAALGLLIHYRPVKLSEDFLLDRLRIERDIKVRGALIACISAGRYSSQQVIDYLISLLTTEGDAYNAARAIAELPYPPDRALPVLVQNLDPTDPPMAWSFLHAISSYGPKAVPHIPALEELAARAEDEELKKMFRQNIDAIKRSVSTTQGT
jgi:hypothetical protein